MLQHVHVCVERGTLDLRTFGEVLISLRFVPHTEKSGGGGGNQTKQYGGAPRLQKEPVQGWQGAAEG